MPSTSAGSTATTASAPGPTVIGPTVTFDDNRNQTRPGRNGFNIVTQTSTGSACEATGGAHPTGRYTSTKNETCKLLTTQAIAPIADFLRSRWKVWTRKRYESSYQFIPSLQFLTITYCTACLEFLTSFQHFYIRHFCDQGLQLNRYRYTWQRWQRRQRRLANLHRKGPKPLHEAPGSIR